MGKKTIITRLVRFPSLSSKSERRHYCRANRETESQFPTLYRCSLPTRTPPAEDALACPKLLSLITWQHPHPWLCVPVAQLRCFPARSQGVFSVQFCPEQMLGGVWAQPQPSCQCHRVVPAPRLTLPCQHSTSEQIDNKQKYVKTTCLFYKSGWLQR